MHTGRHLYIMKKHADMRSEYITKAAMTAALYVVLTLASSLLGLSSGQVQVRLSEALCLLPVLTPAAIPGLYAGCLIANALTGALLPDIIIGSFTTLAGAVLTRRFRGNIYAAAACPIACNAAVIPLLLKWAYGIGPLWLSFVDVLIGEIVSVGFIGIILYKKCLQSIF